METKKIQVVGMDGCPLEKVFIQTLHDTATTDKNGYATVTAATELSNVTFSHFAKNPVRLPFYEVDEIVSPWGYITNPETETKPIDEIEVIDEQEVIPDTIFPAVEIPENQAPKPKGLIEKHWGKLLAAGMVTMILLKPEDNPQNNGK